MKRMAIILTLCCLLLSGCTGWMDGRHVTVTSHQTQIPNVQSGTVSAANYMQLRDVLKNLVESGSESGVINVAEYDPDSLETGVVRAVNYICTQLPLGAYAVESLNYEIGTGGGQPAISVSISYIHGRSAIRQIEKVADMDQAMEEIYRMLESCGEGLVLLVEQYSETDISQLVEDFALANPQTVMETPQVSLGAYPEFGVSRIVEVKFTYQSSRDALRQMQAQVQRVFTSADYYVNSDSTQAQKYSQLYTFLMERFDYKQEKSITPSYSLLVHGVGDSKAFAAVYAAMCAQAELECAIVTGTRDGEPWTWNLICQDGVYYHVDLQRSYEMGTLKTMTDQQMEGYVWDYSAYPEA